MFVALYFLCLSSSPLASVSCLLLPCDICPCVARFAHFSSFSFLLFRYPYFYFTTRSFSAIRYFGFGSTRFRPTIHTITKHDHAYTHPNKPCISSLSSPSSSPPQLPSPPPSTQHETSISLSTRAQAPLRHPPLLHTHRNRVLRRPENGSGRRILHVRRAIHRYVGFQLCCCCEC